MKTLIITILILVTTDLFACGINLRGEGLTLTKDLDCSQNLDHYGILIKGDNIVIEGNGHTIFAPNNRFIIYIEGSNITIRNLRIVGQYGYTRSIVAYNVDGLKIENTIAENHEIAFDYSNFLHFNPNHNYGPIIFNNNNISNSVVGIQYEGKSRPLIPILTNNQFDQIQTGIKIHSKIFRLIGNDNNLFSQLHWAISAKVEELSLDGVQFGADIINPIEVQDAALVSIKNIDLSQRHQKSLIARSVKKISLDNINISNSETGILLVLSKNEQTILEPNQVIFGNHTYNQLVIKNMNQSSNPDYQFDTIQSFDAL